MSAIIDFGLDTHRVREHVIGVPVDVVSWGDAVSRIFHWAQRRRAELCASATSIVLFRRLGIILTRRRSGLRTWPHRMGRRLPG